MATTSMSAAMSICSAPAVPINSAPGDPRHEHDVFGPRVEAVEALRRPPGPDAERGRAPGALLGEDPLRLPHGRHRLHIAALDAGDVPFVPGVALVGQDPQDRHDAY